MVKTFPSEHVQAAVSDLDSNGVPTRSVSDISTSCEDTEGLQALAVYEAGDNGSGLIPLSAYLQYSDFDIEFIMMSSDDDVSYEPGIPQGMCGQLKEGAGTIKTEGDDPLVENPANSLTEIMSHFVITN